MYGEHTFLTVNLLADSTITITTDSLSPGIVSGTQKDGTGSAQLVASGAYSGDVDLLITVQVYDVTAGAEIGSALYRWRTNLTSPGAWEGTGITTHSAAATLVDDIDIRFITGTGDDFVVGDSWTFRAKATWQTGNMFDGDRGTFFRTDVLADPNTITIDLIDPQQFTVVVLYDHNLDTRYELVDVDGNTLVDVDGNDLVTPDTTVTLKANTTASFGSPPYSQALTIADPLVLYLDQTYAHVQLEIQDYGTPLGKVEIGGLYLGTYESLECNAAPGSSEELKHFTIGDPNPQGVLHQQVYAEQTVIQLSFPVVYNDEIDTLKAIVRQLFDVSTGRVSPFFFHLFSDESETLYLMDWRSSLPRSFDAVDVNATAITLAEVVKSRV